MSKRPVPVRSFPLMAVLLTSVFAVVAIDTGIAQQQGDAGRPIIKQPHRGPAIGGTSWTLSDVWGEPEMPPAPRDFGPGFDFSPGGYELNGAPNNSPYPN